MTKIPKIIHYCWVGGNPKPQSVLYCIESWKRCCPDYEIREWNETNYDFTKNEYMRQAYEAKKWGFVPDYARLDIVYRHGGIYLDTDVELLRSFDPLLECDGFMGFENTGDGEFFVNCGHGFGAAAGNEVVRAARDLYDALSFYNADGSLNELASPHFTTRSLEAFGLVQENRDQQLPGMMVYASDVQCPKNFRTGKIKKTSRTISIHHFTASWVDEKIRREMEHQRKIYNLLGKRWGGRALYLESAFQKYGGRLPRQVAKKGKQRLIRLHEAGQANRKLLAASMAHGGTAAPVLLDTVMESDNCGDRIIMENCLHQLSSCMDVAGLTHVPTHRFPTEEERRQLAQAKKKLLCGTNILSGHMGSYGLWKMGADIAPFRETLLMGVGFDSTDESYDGYTRRLLGTILSREGIHSVRDSFSEKKLQAMGIQNVCNTGCPTMWELTPAHCARIPREKGKNVVCTVTDYLRDPGNDSAMLDILLESYDKVWLWLQGREDLDYIRRLGYEEKLELVAGTLESYDALLAQEELDYVGTRLHAGIRALRRGHRSLIVSIDNRAECISRDTGLPILPRADVAAELKSRIHGQIETKIDLPWENIQKWKSQFQR